MKLIKVGEAISAPTLHKLSPLCKVVQLHGVRYEVRVCPKCGTTFYISKRSGNWYVEVPTCDNKVMFCDRQTYDEYEDYCKKFRPEMFRMKHSYCKYVNREDWLGRWFISCPLPVKFWINGRDDITAFKYGIHIYTIPNKRKL